MKEEWKDKLQDSLADFEAPVPDTLWADIETAMQQAAPDAVSGAARPTGGRTRRIVLYALAAAASVACLTGVFVYVNNRDKADAPVVAKAIKQPKPTAKQPAEAESKVEVAEVSRKGRVVAEETASPTTLASNTSVGNGTTVETLAENLSAAAPEETETRETTKPQEAKPRESGQQSHTTLPPAEWFDTEIAIVNKQQSPRLTAALFAENAMAGGGSPSGTAFAPQSTTVLSCQPMLKSYGNTNYVLDNENETVKHHAPVRAGLSVHYAFNKRWGIETGLTYTYLASDMAFGSSDNRHETTQKLHYVGIPVAADFSVYSCRWLRAYVSGGGMVETCVSGKAVSAYVLDGKTVATETADVRPTALQWSVKAAVGVQVNFTNSVGAYVEPSVDYCFGNGSSVKSAYTERPCNFNLKVGLRYSFK